MLYFEEGRFSESFPSSPRLVLYMDLTAEDCKYYVFLTEIHYWFVFSVGLIWLSFNWICKSSSSPSTFVLTSSASFSTFIIHFISAWIVLISADSRTKSIVCGLLHEGRYCMEKLSWCSGATVNLISEPIVIFDSYRISFNIFRSSLTFWKGPNASTSDLIDYRVSVIFEFTSNLDLFRWYTGSYL